MRVCRKKGALTSLTSRGRTLRRREQREVTESRWAPPRGPPETLAEPLGETWRHSRVRLWAPRGRLQAQVPGAHLASPPATPTRASPGPTSTKFWFCCGGVMLGS